MNKLTANQSIALGQRVYTNLYSWGFGVVYAIHGEQSPSSVGNQGPMSWGGKAHFDIAFDHGNATRRLPESILHGIQWTIFEDIASAEEVAATVANAETVKAIKAQKEEQAKSDFAHALEAMRSNPEFKHLSQDQSVYSSRRAVVNVRASLKKAFPGIKFSVRSDHSQVTVRWMDGPTMDAVDAVANTFKAGSFNGMEDIYEYSKSPFTEVFGSIQYISTSREHSDALTAHAINEAFARFAQALDGIERPSIEQHRKGGLYNVPVCTGLFMVDDLQSLISHVRHFTTAGAEGFTTAENLRR